VCTDGDQETKKANPVALSHHCDSRVGLGVTKSHCSFSVAYKP